MDGTQSAGKISSLRFRDSGQSLVEVALVLPSVLLCITGIFAAGITCNNYILLTEATGTAARQLAISRNGPLDPCAATASALYASAPVLNQANLSLSFSLNGSSYSGTSCNSSSYSTGAAGNLVQGKPVVLTVTYPCSFKIYGKNLFPTCILISKTTQISQ